MENIALTDGRPMYCLMSALQVKETLFIGKSLQGCCAKTCREWGGGSPISTPTIPPDTLAKLQPVLIPTNITCTVHVLVLAYP